MDYVTTTVDRLDRARSAGPDVHWTALAGRLVIWGADGAPLGPGTRRSGELRLVTQLGRLFQDEYPDVPVLVDAGRYLVVNLPPGLPDPPADRHCCYRVQALPVDAAVFDVRPPADAASRRTALPWVRDLLGRVDGAGYRADVATLAALPTRHSTSPHFATAVEWARDRLLALGYDTRTTGVTLPGGGTTTNVVAQRAGTGPGPRRIVLATAHLDSVNTAGGAGAPAPGADDNASGCAGVLAIARALQAHTGVHDLRLILFGGEEQGLHGSTSYVAALPADERARVAAVVNMDMIAGRNTPGATVLLEGKALSQSLIDDLAAAAATYTGLTVQTSLDPFASDHVPFLDAGIPAVLTIEGSDRANTRIHTADDTLLHIDDALALDIVRMNLATIATALGPEEGPAMTGPADLTSAVQAPAGLGPVARREPHRLSGRYAFRGGAADPTPPSDPNEPVLTSLPPLPTLDAAALAELRLPRFTLHVDIDGIDPLGVVSGTVRVDGLVPGPPAHFVGRVSSDMVGAVRRDLVVDEFALPWGALTVDRLEVTLRQLDVQDPPTAEVVFASTAAARRFGPFTATRESPWFRDVEVEVDVEDGAVDPEPYDTHLHPDRPVDLPGEHLTLESAFARAGIRISRSAGSNTIDTSEAGVDNGWSEQELHDAMEAHWSAFAGVPQWKMWVFNAERADDPSLGGIMFDAMIDGPGGVDRQGTALFTRNELFHGAGGEYPLANPPAAEAARRELFFDLVHEVGHAFNLAHSFDKQALSFPADSAWPAPSWMPVTADVRALSWMNYPDRASGTGGLNAEWFYDRFRFRFDDGENLFLRHAPERFVQMGDEAWFQNHGRAGKGSVDRRLQLVLRTRSARVAYGEAVFCELRLRNVSDRSVPAQTRLDPAEGMVELAVTGPDGQRRPFLPFYRSCTRPQIEVLGPRDTRYQAVNITMGMFGFPFTQPGTYRIEACYLNVDGSTAPAVMTLEVLAPSSDADRAAADLFTAPVGRVLAVGGSRTIGEVNARIDHVVEQLGEQHPTSLYLAAARALPLATRHKVLAADSARLRVLEPEPDVVERQLAPVVAQPKEAADALGHIGYGHVVDTYTECAVAVRKKARARSAQREMLSLFEARKVVAPVVERVRARVRELA